MPGLSSVTALTALLTREAGSSLVIQGGQRGWDQAGHRSISPDMELFSVGCLDLSHPNRKLSEAGEGLLRDISISRSQAEAEVNILCHWLKTENKPSHRSVIDLNTCST